MGVLGVELIAIRKCKSCRLNEQLFLGYLCLLNVNISGFELDVSDVI